VAEWTNAVVLKTAEVQASVGSNPTPSATHLSTNAPLRTDLVGRQLDGPAHARLPSKLSASIPANARFWRTEP
jgi:hypothetical protein